MNKEALHTLTQSMKNFLKGKVGSKVDLGKYKELVGNMNAQKLKELLEEETQSTWTLLINDRIVDLNSLPGYEDKVKRIVEKVPGWSVVSQGPYVIVFRDE